MPNNYAYIRISTEKQSDGASLEFQKDAIAQYVKNHNLVLDSNNIFIDIESGTKLERKELERMREIIKNSDKVGHLLVYSIDRLTRSVYAGEVIAREIASKGGSIISVTQGFDDSTTTGKMTRQILTVMAEQERDVILKRMTEGKKATVKKGFFSGGHAPIGYSTVGNKTVRGKGQLIINDKEKEAVLLMFQLHKKGKTYRSIAKNLSEAGFLSRKGTAFNPGSIKKIIDNKDFYQGKMIDEDGIMLQHPVLLGEDF